MKIYILYQYFSGYTVACWRELVSRKDVEVKILTPAGPKLFDQGMLQGLPIEILPDARIASPRFQDELVDRLVAEKPDVIFVSGWAQAAYRKVITCAALRHVPKLMFVDTMWEWNWRMLLSRFRLRRFVKDLSGIVVAGERGRCFARYAGFRPEQIFESCYGYDAPAFNECVRLRRERSMMWPKRFAFVGRMEPIKGVDAMMTAYRKYRAWAGKDAWELHCYGAGSMEKSLKDVPGIVLHGFVQPKDLPSVLADAGVFVLPSLRDPWGVALAEGAGAGLPLLASNEVSASVDLLRHLYNGYLFPAGSVDRLAEGFRWLHEHYAELPLMGERSSLYAHAYSTKAWTDRILQAVYSIGA